MAEQVLNVKPVDYKQTDAKWKNVDYSVPGENTTIGRSGCGPTSVADILAIMINKNITPVDTCKWSLEHGYKALKNGTYQSFMPAIFKFYGIECKKMSNSSLYHKPDNPIHDEAKKLVNQGYYLIALAGKGLFTSGGHYICIYQWDDNVVRICDPASNKKERLEADPKIVRNEMKNYWWVNAVDFNRKHGKAEDDEMLSYEQFKEYMTQYENEQAKKKASKWAEQDIKEAVEEGILAKNERAKSYSTREESLAFTMRAYRKLKEMIEKKK